MKNFPVVSLLPSIVGTVSALAFVWLAPPLLLGSAEVPEATRLALEIQMRDVLAKMLWAALTLAGAWGVWRSVRATGEIVEKSSQTLAAAERTAFFAASAAETERYARAMALLGSDSPEVRLGGVFALERLARESQRDHGPIVEVLAAFVRDRAAWNGQNVPAKPAADVGAALTVLGRRHAPFDAEGQRLDLHETVLARAYLPYAQLAGALLYEVNFEGAILQNADLSGAWLWKAQLQGASLEGANLSGADLTGASGLSREQLAHTQWDETTKWPAELRAAMTPDALDRMRASQVGAQVGVVAPAAQERTQSQDSAPPVGAEDLKLPSRRPEEFSGAASRS